MIICHVLPDEISKGEGEEKKKESLDRINVHAEPVRLDFPFDDVTTGCIYFHCG